MLPGENELNKNKNNIPLKCSEIEDVDGTKWKAYQQRYSLLSRNLDFEIL